MRRTLTAILAGLMLQPSSGLSQTDQAKVRQLEYDLMLAETRVSATGIWMRLRPTVQLSASIGLKDALFYDPVSSVIFPRDSYRLTVSLPLHEILNTQKHEEALIERTRLQAELAAARNGLAAAERLRQDRLSASMGEISILKRELALLEDIVRFDSLLFEQGKIKFDALARAKLQSLQTERMLLNRAHQLDNLRRNNALD